jgi:hypothetical protein
MQQLNEEGQKLFDELVALLPKPEPKPKLICVDGCIIGEAVVVVSPKDRNWWQSVDGEIRVMAGARASARQSFLDRIGAMLPTLDEVERTFALRMRDRFLVSDVVEKRGQWTVQIATTQEDLDRLWALERRAKLAGIVGGMKRCR